MKNKKDLLALVGLLILISLFSFFYLYLKPALSQTAQKYTVFKTENEGFKFVKKIIVDYNYKWVEVPSKNKSYTSGPIYQLPCGKDWSESCGDFYPRPSPIATDTNVAYDIDEGCSGQRCWKMYKGYVYYTTLNGYYRDSSLDFGVDYNTRKFWYPGKSGQVSEGMATCDFDWNKFECLNERAYQFDLEGYDVKIYKDDKNKLKGYKITIEAKYVKPNIGPIYNYTFAPIFAQTPTTTSPGNQVVTKEYLHSITDVILDTIAKSPEDAAYSGSLSLDYYTYVRDPSRDQGGHVGNRLPCDTSWRNKNCPDSYSVVTDLGEYAYDWDGGCSFFGGCWRYSYAYRRTNSQSIVADFFRYDLLGRPYSMLISMRNPSPGNSAPIPMDLFDEFCADYTGCDVYIYQTNPFWGEFGKCIKRNDSIYCDWGDRGAVAVDGNGKWEFLHGGNCDLIDAKVVNWNGNDNATDLYLYQTGGSGSCRIFIKDY